MAQPELPAWAGWSPAGAERPWTVGVEEEVMLLDGQTWRLSGRIEEVLEGLPAGMGDRVTRETHACAAALATLPHATVGAAVSELAGLREDLALALEPLGVRAAVSGTHPWAEWTEAEVSVGPRYRLVHSSMRVLARREPTFALHVHVAVPDGDAAVRALCALRGDLPLLLALAANSPYWQGRETGLASARVPVFSMFPRVGIPREFASYAAYVEALDLLLRADAVPDPSFVWWDARLQPRFGTVEVRIMDAQTDLADTAALAALVQCLVWLGAEGEPGAAAPPAEALAENRFLALRDGMEARFVVGLPPWRKRAAVRLVELQALCAPLARQLGCAAELNGLASLARDPGHARQRATVAEVGLAGLPAALSERFAPALAAPHTYAL